MPRKHLRYLYEDVPVPRRTEYRRRREAQLAEMQQASDTDSDGSNADAARAARQVVGAVGPNLALLNPFEENAGDLDLEELPNEESAISSETSSLEVNASQSEGSNVIADSASGGSDHESALSNEDGNVSEDNNVREVIDNEGDLNIGDNEEDIADHEEEINVIENNERVELNDGVNGEQVLLNNLLCACSGTTEGDALLMCLALGIRHNLSWLAMVDILNFVNKLYGREVVHASKYFLLKFFDKSKQSACVHHYCSNCEKYLGTRDLVVQEGIAQCECGVDVQYKGPSASYFVSMKLEDRFKEIMETPDVAQEIMTYRFQRKKDNDDAIEDIFDGEGYKAFSRGDGPLSVAKNLSVTFNTDGMVLGPSSARSAWPIFLYINELPPKLRKKYVIFAGVWVGQKQPNMRIFLRPFIDNLRSLSTDGFQWVDVNGGVQTSKVFPLISVLDSGARYKFLNLTCFSGYFGCTYCYQKAENTAVGRRFTVVPNPAPLRTQESMVQDMRIAHANRNHRNEKSRIHRGCKGFTPLVRLYPYLNLGSSIIVDFMHNALLGVTRYHTSLLLETVDTPFYIGTPENLRTMDSRLLSMRPPTSITRTPSELTSSKKWKASEWRSFMLFYGLLCYDKILSKQYLEHFALLSAAFYILLQKSISMTELETAHKYLRQFVFLHQRHFGTKSMTYNVHLLLHVTEGVRNWGPLWGPNTFVFEGENRHLGQMNTSSGEVALQLARRYNMFSSYPKLCEKYASSDKPLDFIQSITGRNLKSYVMCDSSVLIGQGTRDVLSQEDLMFLRESGIFCDPNVLYFDRLINNSLRYTTKTYSEGKKNDDSWVSTRFGTRGYIDKILKVLVRGRNVAILIIQEVTIDRQPVLKSNFVTVTHLKRVVGTGQLRAVKLGDIRQQCIHFDLDSGSFIADIPYGSYGD